MGNDRFLDIKPSQRRRVAAIPKSEDPVKKSALNYKRKKRGGVFFILFAGLIVFIVTILVLVLINFTSLAKNSGPVIYEGFKQFGEKLLEMQPEEARKALANVSLQIEELKKHPALSFWLSFIPKVKDAPEVLDELNNLAEISSIISEDFQYLKENAFNLIVDQKGQQLLSRLEGLSANIAKAEKASSDLRNKAADLGYVLGGEFVSTNAKMQQARKFIDALVAWLSQAEKQNIVLLFQNPSEIRPAGGFAGSYAEVFLDKGSLAHLKVNDIYYPDKFLELKVIPPKPLQLITPNWGARDAGWFFDFPTSAAKIIEMLEASDIYKESELNFSALIGINVHVVESILEIIGPIELKEYGLTITQENFLAEVQREVEAGEDKAAGDPKRILRVLTPIFFEKISQMDDRSKHALIEKIKQHMTAKDIMVFFEDPVLESYIQTAGLGGEIYMLPNNFSGDYLAIVSSNIAGGKSDEFITQKIRWDSKIDLNGNASNYLIIDREHFGKNQKDWWYRAMNKNYIQILVPKSASLSNVGGNVYRFIKEPINYSAKGYKQDPDIKAIEGTTKFRSDFAIEELYQFGKKTFATWFDVKAGERKKLEIKYENANVLDVEQGSKYNFIFDKQAGVGGSLQLAIRAPLGFKWLETGSPLFERELNNLPARIEIILTLQEI